MRQLILLLPALSLIMAQAGAQIAIRAGIIHTASGAPVQNGILLVKNGKIENIGAASRVTIPVGYTVYDAAVVTPGLIDARSVVGFSGAYNIPADQDQLEKSAPVQPELRAIDAYNPEEKLVKYVRDNGVTTLHTGHGIGALISGQTMIVKTKPGNVESVLINPLAMLAMTIGPSVQENYPSPGTKAKQIAMLRTELIKTRTYMDKLNSRDTSKWPAADLKYDVLARLLKREIKALVTANTANDIMNAIRLSREFNFILVIDGAAEAYRLIDEIKASKAQIILHATMARNDGELLNMTRESAALLTKAGIPVSIESGYEAYVPKTRVILWEAALAVANGLSYEEGIRSVTLHPARLLGIDNRVGSIEKGKDADLVLYNGDPFEYLTKVCKVMIDGVWVSDNCLSAPAAR